MSQEENFLEDMYLYQLKEGKSQNPTVAVHINGILISLHLDTKADVTVVTEKHYGKLKANCPLRQTSITIRSSSGEGEPAATCARKIHCNTHSRIEGDNRAGVCS